MGLEVNYGAMTWLRSGDCDGCEWPRAGLLGEPNGRPQSQVASNYHGKRMIGAI